MTLRCPICFAPLVVARPETYGWVCSKYPYGYQLLISLPDAKGSKAHLVIPEAGWCPPNCERAWSPDYEAVCMHAKEGTGGWALYLDSSVLVPVKDSLVDLVADVKRGEGGSEA